MLRGKWPGIIDEMGGAFKRFFSVSRYPRSNARALQNKAKRTGKTNLFLPFNKQEEIFSPLAAEGKFDYQST